MARTYKKDKCPGWKGPCNNVKHTTSSLCMECSGKKQAARQEELAEKKRIDGMLERHRMIKSGKIPNPWTKILGHPPGVAPVVHKYWETSGNL